MFMRSLSRRIPPGNIPHVFPKEKKFSFAAVPKPKARILLSSLITVP